MDAPTTNSNQDKMPTTDPKPEEYGKRKRPASSPPPTANKRHTKPSPPPTPTHLSSKDLPPTWHPSPSSPSPKSPTFSTPTLTLTYHTGSIFAAPRTTLLIHACNTQGSWGAGIALAFRTSYPEAYKIYRTFCTVTHSPKTKPVPTGTALLIPPVDEEHGHWIGCLFTSAGFGKGRDGSGVIVRNTRPAVEMLMELVGMVEGKEVGEVRMCKINSGKFGVEWERTAEVLEGIEMRDGWRRDVQIWEP